MSETDIDMSLAHWLHWENIRAGGGVAGFTPW